MAMQASRPLVLFCCALSIGLLGCDREEPPRVPETRASAAEARPAAAPPTDVATDSVEITIPLRPNVVTRCVPGSRGAETTTFAAGEPVELMMTLAEAPPELKVAARLIDAQDRVVARADTPAGGKQAVSVVIQQKLEPGTYRLEGYWGGNLVCEHDVKVE